MPSIPFLAGSALFFIGVYQMFLVLDKVRIIAPFAVWFVYGAIALMGAASIVFFVLAFKLPKKLSLQDNTVSSSQEKTNAPSVLDDSLKQRIRLILLVVGIFLFLIGGLFVRGMVGVSKWKNDTANTSKNTRSFMDILNCLETRHGRTFRDQFMQGKLPPTTESALKIEACTR